MKKILTFLLVMTMLFTMFPTATLAGGVDVGTDVATEQIVKGTISFPEDAYLEGGSLIVDVWTRGQITGEYKKVEFEIDSLEDVDFEFLFPADETAVSTRVMLKNLSGAKTNLYTDTSSNLDFTLTENGMEDTYEFHYVDIAELATKEILMPCGKMISGTISGDNLQFVENACLTLVFGNYWSRAFIDVETHEYSAVMPYGITEGYYAASVENSSENATSNILNGQYYYTESESVTINPAEDLTDLNFTVDTGYAVSGEVTIPEDAVIENFDITSVVEFNDTPYYVTGLTTKPSIGEKNRSIPFMFGVNDEITTTFALETYGYMADDMLSSTSYSNVLVNTVYYYSDEGTTLDKSKATDITINSDVTGIVFELQTGAVINAEITVPESVSEQYICYDLYAISLDGDIIAEVSDRTMPDNDVNFAQLVVPDTYEEVYLMYKVNYDVYGDYPDIYTGKAYINTDGSITGFRSDADSHSTYEGVTVQFELAEFDDVEIPETLEYEDNALESSHPFLSSNTESIYYAYDGDEDASNLKVTFSPLSWINEKATITICDAESNSTTYTAEEFNECISGETIDITGPKFTVTITSVYTSQYMYDYGFSITDVTPGKADETDTEDKTASFNFKVYDNSVASAMLIPIEGATVIITDGQGFSYMGESDENGGITAELELGKTYSITVSKSGYSTYTSEFEATADNAEKTNYIPLVVKSTGGDVPDTNKTVSFTVIDKDTDYPVSGATLTITEVSSSSAETGTATPEVYSETFEITDITSDGETVITTSVDGTASVELANGTYEVIVSKDGYVTKTETIEVSDDEYEFQIEIETIEVVIGENTTFYVKDGDLETTPAISGASLTIEDADGNIITKSTDSNGKADANLDNGTYYVSAIADGYKTRSFKIERTDAKNSFTVYLNKDDIITVKSTVKEMTSEEMKEAGIDTDNIGNKQVYNCTAVLSFMPDVSINYYYDSDGGIVKGGKPITVYVENTAITPVGRDIYLIVKSSTTWLKETFEVQIVCDNTSAVETVENLTANLTIPEGLSLAIMTEGMVNEATAVLGDVLPKGTTSHKWYICGDKEGEYSLDGTLTGTRTGGGISENINLTFGIEDSINVLAGSALKLTIDAETHGIVGEPYYMRYTLENASDKSLYDLSFSVFGGKFFEDFGVNEIKYAKEYGPDATQDLDGRGFVFETEEFKPDDKVQGVFEIEFGKDLLLGEGQEWILKQAFVITGAGSTTEIPVTINWEYDVPAHDWKEGVVTKAATCTEDGIMTYECKDEDCEETYTERISATGHNMGGYITVQPTCTSEGYETSKCQNEGCDHTVVLPLAKTEHDWKTEFTIDTPPTCTEKGSKSRHCANCSATTDVQDVKETGHDYAKEWTIDVAAKCEEKGSESRHCSHCSATTDKRDIAETGHNFTEWKTRIEAQCETAGEEYRICQNSCGKEETKPIDALGHDWDDGTITKNPTETEEGNKLYNCKQCPATKNETLPTLIKQDIGFTVPAMTYTYGDKEAIYNEAYNDSEDGSELTYSSSNEKVATVDKDGKVTIIGAGEATITATAAATDKYLETTASFKLTIKKASLTITANDAEIYYGEEGKNNGFTATGFVLGESEAVIKGTPLYEINYKQLDKAGEYEITVDKLTADNYEITFKPGKLTVKKAEVYNIDFSNLSQRKGKISEVTASATPKDDTAKIKIEYQFTDGVWVDTIPSDIGIGEYKVRAYLTESENLAINETPKYFESTLEIKAGAVVNLDGNSDLSIDSNVSGDNVEFAIPDEAVEEIVNNVPESGEIVIDATGSTGGVTNLTLPENIITALDESENVNTFTVIADDAEISMSADVLKTVADEMSAGDKVNVHIEAVEKESLNEEQKAALDAIATDAHVLQLNLEVQKQNGTTKLHELNGKVEVKAAYTLPADMNGKKIVVCYVSDNGTVTYMRATYKDGFVHFKTDHFSHYAIAAIECTHTWDVGTVITQATTSSEGLKRYECTICGETKDETIPKKTSYSRSSVTASYTVKFDTNGARIIKSQSINKNGIVTEPSIPTREGYTFEGWFIDEELTVAYDFATKVTKSFTLYAKWTELEKQPEDNSETPMAFTDVKSTDWFYKNVQYVVENNLMNGISENEFTPNNVLTRAMLVTVLYRNAGEPATNRSIPFADVDMGTWYANAVIWAKQNGIINGVTENEFAPDANITREQIATIMFRYAQYKGMDAVTLEENLHFTDSSEISEYAVSAMNWAVGTGLMKGKSATTLNPKDNATRAEIAAILQRFIEANK